MHTRPHANGKKRDADDGDLDAADSARALVAAGGEVIKDELAPVVDDLEDELEAARHKLRRLETQIKAKAASVDEVVHTHAWKLIGAAAGVGLGVGFIAGALTFRK